MRHVLFLTLYLSNHTSARCLCPDVTLPKYCLLPVTVVLPIARNKSHLVGKYQYSYLNIKHVHSR